MRVLQLIDSLEAGGAERVAVNIANSLAAKMEKSYLCATRKEGPLKASIHDDVGYLFLNKQGVLDVQAIAKLSRFIKSEGIAIIHAHSTSFFLATLVKLRCPNVKIIWHDHYGDRSKTSLRVKFFLNVCALSFASVIAVSKTIQEWLTDNLITYKKVVYTLPNFAVIREENADLKFNKLEGEDGKRIICLANLRPEKGHLCLIEAFNSIQKKNPEWTLHLVGRDLKDDYSEAIKAKIKALNLNQNIFTYGSISDINYILNQASFGVLTSVYEGFPMVLLEYGLASLPVVCTNVGDCDKIIENERTGLLISSNSVEALEEALLYYIDHPLKREVHAKQLNKHVCLNFSEEVVISQLVSIYNRSLS
ncbi:glycosyltransferase family 4 protein [Bizionia paragorgiae]|uniref:glycosyltransferase family 4 protein n=1 Tax=Bizionia paragorgiae TaxID=283786 RepID=UPI003A8E5F67